MYWIFILYDFLLDAETASPSHGSHLSEVEKNNLTSSEMSDNSQADAEMAEKKRLAAERRKKLLDQVYQGFPIFSTAQAGTIRPYEEQIFSFIIAYLTGMWPADKNR